MPCRFSVVIPCHNAGRWIGHALRSVAAQTYAPEEIIVVDDSSTDDSIERIQATGVKVQLLRTCQRNAAAARNIGIEVARGDWVALLDADDEWYPNHLESAARLLENSSDVAFIADHDWINVHGAVVPMASDFQCEITTPTVGLRAQEFISLLTKRLHFGHSTVIYQRQRLLECGGFDVQQLRRHDIDMWLRVTHNHTWTYDSVCQVGYRVDTPDSISKAEVNCEYYWLRALLKNATAYDSPEMRSLVATSARRAMGIAFVDGTKDDLVLARHLAWPYLRPGFRAFYRCAAVFPSLLRAFLRRRRRITWRHLLTKADGNVEPSRFRYPLLEPSRPARILTAGYVFLAFVVLVWCAVGVAVALHEQLWVILLTAAGAAVALALFLMWFVRRSAYLKYVSYNPKLDYQYDFSAASGACVSVAIDHQGFSWPDVKSTWDTAILEWKPVATILGQFFDPIINVHCDGSSCRQWLERGVSGIRYLDLTSCAKSPMAPGQRVQMRGQHLRWTPQATLRLFQNNVSDDTHVTVLAPHPDDAELAAFGMYARCDSSIVTTCAGNIGSTRYPNFPGMAHEAAAIRATIRVCESISVPILAGVAASRCINLCYADNSLASLYHCRTSPPAERPDERRSFHRLRSINLSSGSFDVSRPAGSWNDILDDLCEVLTEESPSIVAAPHPVLESHLDHSFSTVALVSAAQRLGLNDLRFFLYVVHPTVNESYPLGPKVSTVSLWPHFGSAFRVSSIFSQPLSPQQQYVKHLALEAMHDLRPLRLMQNHGFWFSIKEALRALYEIVTGVDRDVNSLFRRAVRPNEIFLVATLAEAERVVDDFLRHLPDSEDHTSSMEGKDRVETGAMIE